VDFALLRKALKTSSCCNSSAGGSQYLMVLPCDWATWSPWSSLFVTQQSPVNGTCAVVQLSPGLPPPSKSTKPPGVQVGLKLSLPKGSLYSKYAGPYKEAMENYVSVIQMPW
jgi:hypothetical protein